MWCLVGSQAVDQPICGFGPGSRMASLSSALGLGCSGGWRDQPLWALVVCSQSFCCFGPVSGAAILCSWCAPTRGFRCGRPAGVSGVGGQLGFQLWAPSPLIWVHTTGLQVSTGAAYPVFTVQGLRGEGCQRPRLLPRVL